jgi:hypothetical protein
LNQNTVNETIILVQCWLWFHWLYFGWMLTFVSLTVFGWMLTIVSLTVFWFNAIEPKYSQWNNTQHWTKIQSMKQSSTLNQNTVNETIVNIEPKYSQWNDSQHWTKINFDYCFVDCILVQCWLLFHWLYFGSMLTIVSLTAFCFNVDYCFIDCILAQWWLLFHWLYVGSMFTTVSLTVFWLNGDYCFINCTFNQNTVSETIVNIEPKYSQWNNSQHWTKIQSMK